MSKREPALLLHDILDSAEKIFSYTNQYSFANFISDDRTIDAVIRNFEIIGEAANKLPKEFKEANPTIDWQRIRGFRNRIVHDYFGIDYRIVWNVIESYLPIVQHQIQSVIPSLVKIHSMLYPLKFQTIFKDKIWGGNKIKTYLCKDFSPLPNCGETWEISGVKSDVSVVANGNLAGQTLASLIEDHKGKLTGEKVYSRFGNEFPLLVKFIDANDDLSIQVHPNDELAKKRHNSFGKTEMWYVIQADEGATLITGFNQQVDEGIYLAKLNSGRLTDILNSEKVEAGDIFFLPAGRVHTIGKGLLIAEIQQTSDITYRIYDFDRVDDKGNKRELHTEEALAALDYTVYPEYKTNYLHKLNEAVNAVTCNYFITNVLDFTQSIARDYAALDSFVIHVCVSGSYTLVAEGIETEVKMGECVLIPAAVKDVSLETDSGFKILESYIE